MDIRCGHGSWLKPKDNYLRKKIFLIMFIVFIQ